jgi:flagellar protein FlbD
MIELTRLNGEAFVLNAELIETIAASPDTVITLVNGHRYVVKESVDTVTEKVIQYKRKMKAF